MVSNDDPSLHRCVGITGLEWQVLSHLGVDDADGGFIPHVSRVPFRRRGVETQDGIVSVWRMKHWSEWKRVTSWPRGRNDTLEIMQNAAAALAIVAHWAWNNADNWIPEQDQKKQNSEDQTKQIF